MLTNAYVYRWTQLSTGKWYIGSRIKAGCHPEDGYICSSKIVKPLISENQQDWHRELLAIGKKKATVTCNSCGITCSIANYSRWYGPNCNKGKNNV